MIFRPFNSSISGRRGNELVTSPRPKSIKRSLAGHHPPRAERMDSTTNIETLIEPVPFSIGGGSYFDTAHDDTDGGAAGDCKAEESKIDKSPTGVDSRVRSSASPLSSAGSKSPGQRTSQSSVCFDLGMR